MERTYLQSLEDGSIDVFVMEDGFPVGFKVDENDRFLLDSNHNDQTITLSDVGSLTFAEIREQGIKTDYSWEYDK